MKALLLVSLLSAIACAGDWLQPIRDVNTINEFRERRERQQIEYVPPPPGVYMTDETLLKVIESTRKEQQKKDRENLRCVGSFCFRIDAEEK